MKKGTVKFFNTVKGFGFITDDAGQEIFVHVSGLKDEVREHDHSVAQAVAVSGGAGLD